MRETVIFVLAITALSWIPYQINAGTSSFYRKEPITQILFILDGSGSMKAGWEGTTRFEIAKRLLVQTIDSIEKANQNVRFALRVFGHQYPKSENNCKDSKLEVAFAANNADKIRRKLDLVHPQGWTPIAYSIFNSMNDFPILNQGGVHNIIILITDGVENCEGDPCAIGEELLKRGIVLKPFIIGLGMDMEDIAKFDCVGQFYDAADREAFANTLDIVVSQALHNTTAQVNLLDDYGNPTQTNVEMTFYNAFTDEIEYNFVHTMISPGVPDTIPINPVGKYNLVVHTIPPTFKYNIELTPGRHNIIPVDVPQGILSISMDRFAGSEEFQCLIRQAGSPQTLTLKDINSKQN